MKLFFVSIGTRGDLQPMSMLCQAASLRFHECVIYSSVDKKTFIDTFGINFKLLHDTFDCSKWFYSMRTDPSKGKIMLEDLQHHGGMKLFEEAKLHKPDAILFNHLCDFAIFVCRKLGIPCVFCGFCPYIPSDNLFSLFPLLDIFETESNRPSSGKTAFHLWWTLLNRNFDFGPLANYFSHYKRMEYLCKREGIQKLLKDIHSNTTPWGLMEIFYSSSLLKLNFWSSSLYTNNDNDEIQYVGFMDTKMQSSVLQVESLNSFLCNFPILVTFGSMFSPNMDNFVEVIVNTLINIGEYVILCGEYSHNIKIDNKSKLMSFTDIDYESIFPQIKGIIFHGGLGTFGNCLKHKIPMFIIPCIYDQLFWANIAWKRFEISVEPILMDHFDELLLSEKIHLFLSSIPSIKQNFEKIIFQNLQCDNNEVFQMIEKFIVDKKILSEDHKSFTESRRSFIHNKTLFDVLTFCNYKCDINNEKEKAEIENLILNNDENLQLIELSNQKTIRNALNKCIALKNRIGESNSINYQQNSLENL